MTTYRGGEGTVYRVGTVSVKIFNASIKPADAALRCKLSRMFKDFAPRWYLPRYHAAIGAWQFGRWADHKTIQSLAVRYPWASDWKDENVIITNDGPRVIDFGIVPGADLPD